MYSYYGYCRTQLDYLVLFEAAKQGLIHKRKERLSVSERENIESGAIYIWDESETGIKRWTDGKFWSTSRVLSHFLVYRELDNVEKSLYSSGCRIKPYGLCKQATNTMTSDSSKLHLIGYYSKRDVRQGKLMQPSLDVKFRDVIAKVKAQLLNKDHSDSRYATSPVASPAVSPSGYQNESQYLSTPPEVSTENLSEARPQATPLSPPSDSDKLCISSMNPIPSTSWFAHPDESHKGTSNEMIADAQYLLPTPRSLSSTSVVSKGQSDPVGDAFWRLTPPLQPGELEPRVAEFFRGRASDHGDKATDRILNYTPVYGGVRKSVILPPPKPHHQRLAHHAISEDVRVLTLLNRACLVT